MGLFDPHNHLFGTGSFLFYALVVAGAVLFLFAFLYSRRGR